MDRSWACNRSEKEQKKTGPHLGPVLLDEVISRRLTSQPRIDILHIVIVVDGIQKSFHFGQRIAA